MNRIFVVFAMPIISSCATTKRSIVAMKINDTESHIAMGNGEVNSDSFF